MDCNNSGYLFIRIFLLLQVVWLVRGMNSDCNGKAFFCTNSTHFKICVDLGGGVSTTVDDFLIPCPPNSYCKKTNNYECEYEITTTSEPTTWPTEVMKKSTEFSVLKNTFNGISTSPLPYDKKEEFLKNLYNSDSNNNNDINVNSEFENNYPTKTKTFDIRSSPNVKVNNDVTDETQINESKLLTTTPHTETLSTGKVIKNLTTPSNLSDNKAHASNIVINLNMPGTQIFLIDSNRHRNETESTTITTLLQTDNYSNELSTNINNDSRSSLDSNSIFNISKPTPNDETNNVWPNLQDTSSLSTSLDGKASNSKPSSLQPLFELKTNKMKDQTLTSATTTPFVKTVTEMLYDEPVIINNNTLMETTTEKTLKIDVITNSKGLISTKSSTVDTNTTEMQLTTISLREKSMTETINNEPITINNNSSLETTTENFFNINSTQTLKDTSTVNTNDQNLQLTNISPFGEMTTATFYDQSIIINNNTFPETKTKQPSNVNSTQILKEIISTNSSIGRKNDQILQLTTIPPSAETVTAYLYDEPITINYNSLLETTTEKSFINLNLTKTSKGLEFMKSLNVEKNDQPFQFTNILPLTTMYNESISINNNSLLKTTTEKSLNINLTQTLKRLALTKSSTDKIPTDDEILQLTKLNSFAESLTDTVYNDNITINNNSLLKITREQMSSQTSEGLASINSSLVKTNYQTLQYPTDLALAQAMTETLYNEPNIVNNDQLLEKTTEKSFNLNLTQTLKVLASTNSSNVDTNDQILQLTTSLPRAETMTATVYDKSNTINNNSLPKKTTQSPNLKLIQTLKELVLTKSLPVKSNDQSFSLTTISPPVQTMNATLYDEPIATNNNSMLETTTAKFFKLNITQSSKAFASTKSLTLDNNDANLELSIAPLAEISSDTLYDGSFTINNNSLPDITTKQSSNINLKQTLKGWASTKSSIGKTNDQILKLTTSPLAKTTTGTLHDESITVNKNILLETTTAKFFNLNLTQSLKGSASTKSSTDKKNERKLQFSTISPVVDTNIEALYNEPLVNNKNSMLETITEKMLNFNFTQTSKGLNSTKLLRGKNDQMLQLITISSLAKTVTTTLFDELNNNLFLEASTERSLYLNLTKALQDSASTNSSIVKTNNQTLPLTTNLPASVTETLNREHIIKNNNLLLQTLTDVNVGYPLKELTSMMLSTVETNDQTLQLSTVPPFAKTGTLYDEYLTINNDPLLETSTEKFLNLNLTQTAKELTSNYSSSGQIFQNTTNFPLADTVTATMYNEPVTINSNPFLKTSTERSFLLDLTQSSKRFASTKSSTVEKNDQILQLPTISSLTNILTETLYDGPITTNKNSLLKTEATKTFNLNLTDISNGLKSTKSSFPKTMTTLHNKSITLYNKLVLQNTSKKQEEPNLNQTPIHLEPTKSSVIDTEDQILNVTEMLYNKPITMYSQPILEANTEKTLKLNLTQTAKHFGTTKISNIKTDDQTLQLTTFSPFSKTMYTTLYDDFVILNKKFMVQNTAKKYEEMNLGETPNLETTQSKIIIDADGQTFTTAPDSPRAEKITTTLYDEPITMNTKFLLENTTESLNLKRDTSKDIETTTSPNVKINDQTLPLMTKSPLAKIMTLLMYNEPMNINNKSKLETNIENPVEIELPYGASHIYEKNNNFSGPINIEALNKTLDLNRTTLATSQDVTTPTKINYFMNLYPKINKTDSHDIKPLEYKTTHTTEMKLEGFHKQFFTTSNPQNLNLLSSFSTVENLNKATSNYTSSYKESTIIVNTTLNDTKELTTNKQQQLSTIQQNKIEHNNQNATRSIISQNISLLGLNQNKTVMASLTTSNKTQNATVEIYKKVSELMSTKMEHKLTFTTFPPLLQYMSTQYKDIEVPNKAMNVKDLNIKSPQAHGMVMKTYLDESNLNIRTLGTLSDKIASENLKSTTQSHTSQNKSHFILNFLSTELSFINQNKTKNFKIKQKINANKTDPVTLHFTTSTTYTPTSVTYATDNNEQVATSTEGLAVSRNVNIKTKKFRQNETPVIQSVTEEISRIEAIRLSNSFDNTMLLNHINENINNEQHVLNSSNIKIPVKQPTISTKPGGRPLGYDVTTTTSDLDSVVTDIIKEVHVKPSTLTNMYKTNSYVSTYFKGDMKSIQEQYKSTQNSKDVVANENSGTTKGITNPFHNRTHLRNTLLKFNQSQNPQVTTVKEDFFEKKDRTNNMFSNNKQNQSQLVKTNKTTTNTDTSLDKTNLLENQHLLKKSTIKPIVTSFTQVRINYGINCLNRFGGKYSDNSHCRKFYICAGETLPLVGECPNNTVFSDINKQCTKNLSHCVRNNQFICSTHGRFYDLTLKNTYYICVRNKRGYLRFKYQCSNGYSLNKMTVRCVKIEKQSSQSASESESNDTKDGRKYKKSALKEPVNKKFECKSEGKFADPKNCRKYYVCKKNNDSSSNGIEFYVERKKCGSDQIWHRKKEMCVNDSFESD